MSRAVFNNLGTMASKNIPYRRVNKDDVLVGSYMHKFPNRRERRAILRARENSHNNRKTTKARVTARVELKVVVSTKDPKTGKRLINLVPTGIIRSIRKPINWKFGGNNDSNYSRRYYK